MEIILIRHGEAEGENRYNMDSDKLTDNGIRQIEKISLDGKYDIILTSDILRAVESAKILSKKYGIEIKSMKELREKSSGIWHGKTKDLVISKHFDGDFYTRKIPEGESINDVISRVKKFIEYLKKSKYKRIIIVGHGTWIKIFLAIISDVDVQGFIINNKIRNAEKRVVQL